MPDDVDSPVVYCIFLEATYPKQCFARVAEDDATPAAAKRPLVVNAADSPYDVDSPEDLVGDSPAPQAAAQKPIRARKRCV